MPRSKKNTAGDTADMRDIEAYTHDGQKRTNNPPVGMAQHDTAPETRKTYTFDPHLDPRLDWAGKTEGMSFDVPTSSIHIHESIKPHKIIRSVRTMGDGYVDQQTDMFGESPAERMRRRNDAIEFYQHGMDWTNRLIAGDSLVVMNSLIEKEGMAGQVQMVYVDPPYGIKYGSNFQPFVNKRDVKDKNDNDLTQEPEMVKAFRDTWELGIHSYLTYLRNRLLLARELLAETGSVFVQISDENVHLVRCLCDEVFGYNNFCSMITFQKSGGTSAVGVERMCDYLLFYAKNIEQIKYRKLFTPKNEGKNFYRDYSFLEFNNGTSRKIRSEEIGNLPDGARAYRLVPCNSQHYSKTRSVGVNFNGVTYYPGNDRQWSIDPELFQTEIVKRRLIGSENSLYYKLYADEVPGDTIKSVWMDTAMAGLTTDKSYVVQTSPKVIQRCMLMTTDPSDLVLDITCGSGTTAFVAEQWGRRWITCDTSRIAITLAKKRLMTATYDYYKLAQESQGVSGGFIYKTVPHITLKSIANNEPPATETLYDQPEIDKKKLRISGPFTVEALPAPVGGAVNAIPLSLPSDGDNDSGRVSSSFSDDYSAKQSDWRDELLATGILGRGGAKIEFSRVEPLSGTVYLQAEAETTENAPRRAVICFAGETVPMDSRMVKLALDEAEELRPSPKLIVFAAFQFDPEAAKDIDNVKWPDVTVLKVQMNTDLMTNDLKKKRSSNQSFWLVGQPDAELVKIEKGKDAGKYQVHVKGFDYYDVLAGKVVGGDANRIAMWSLDTDYDGMSLEPMQVFFPMGGGWERLARTLRAEINQELIEAYGGTVSLPFEVKGGAAVAVKIIDDRGIECMKVIKVGVRD